MLEVKSKKTLVNNNGEMENCILWDKSNAVETGQVRAGQGGTGYLFSPSSFQRSRLLRVCEGA